MKILHTSDWHLGRNLYGRKRYAEFEAFLEWLYITIISEKIDTLLICGDIFDTNTPSNKAQELYYQFLCKTAQSSCNDIIIIAGNHDSPSFLEAPKNLLSALNIHVIGVPDVQALSFAEHKTREEQDEDLKKTKIPLKEQNILPKEIILLEGENASQRIDKNIKNPNYKAIICAVPYLRDRDMRKSELGESFEEKHTNLLQGIQTHYANIAKKARNIQATIREEQGNTIPIIALGHLFVAGGVTFKGDGVRELYVGSLASIGADTFSPNFDYVALGHLHIEQKVNHNEYIRYCGSPIPMSFGEALQSKKVFILQINQEKDALGYTKDLKALDVPTFQKLMQISGDLADIKENIGKILEANKKKSDETEKKNTDSIWLEIEYTGKSLVGNLREELEECILGTNIEILRIRNTSNYEKTLRASQNIDEQKSLHDLSVEDVFEACLLSREVPFEEQKALRETYQEILREMTENDLKAE